MGVERRVERLQAAPLQGDGLHERDGPVLARAEREHHLEGGGGMGGFGAVALVEHDDVGDLRDPRLDRLDPVARAGGADEDRGAGEPRHLDLALPDADGLDEDDFAAPRLEDPHRLRRAAAQPPRSAAVRHAPDEHPGIGRVPLHPHAVAEDRPAAERARRVHGQNPHDGAAPASERHETVDERALPRAGGAGDADDIGGLRPAVERLHLGRGARVAVLDPGEEAARGAGVSIEHLCGDIHRISPRLKARRGAHG